MFAGEQRCAAWKALLFLLAGIPGLLLAEDPNGTTALHLAVHEDRTEDAIRLIGEGADVNVANRYGVTSLSLACENGNEDVIAALLEAGADPNTALIGGATPLMIAARVGLTGPVEKLLEHGARIDATEKRGQTALIWAAAEGNADVVEHLIAAGADPDRKLSSGFTPILFAARDGHAGVVGRLLARGVDPNSAIEGGSGGRNRPGSGTSALRFAVENGHFDLALDLVEAGADPNKQSAGFAPLHVLTWVRKPHRGDGFKGMPAPRGSGKTSSLEFARRLVEEFGADVNLRLSSGGQRTLDVGEKGATAFLLAAQREDLPYLKLLFELGADPRLPNLDKVTPLLAAAGVGAHAPEEEAGTEGEALEVVEWLLGLGCDIDARTSSGDTVMHGAAYRNWPAMVRLLDEHGADIGVWHRENRKGWTPLHIARGYRRGNFKPSVATGDAIKEVLAAAGVPIPPHPPMPTTDKPKKYEER